MVGHPRRAAISAVIAAALALPLVLPAGAALARDPRTAVPQPVSGQTSVQQNFWPGGAALGGMVVDPNLAPASGITAQVCMLVWSGGATGAGGAPPPAPGGCWSAVTSGGSFGVTLPGPGDYTVQFMPPPGSPLRGGWYNDGAPGNFSPSWASPVHVWGSVGIGTTVLPWSSTPPVPGDLSISGTVWGANSGSWWVTGASSAQTMPPPSAHPFVVGTVTACPGQTWNQQPLWSCRSATIGWNGTYSITGLAPGFYRVSVNATWYPWMPGPGPWPLNPTWTANGAIIGYYSATAPGHFTTSIWNATIIRLLSSDVVLPTIFVPPMRPNPPAPTTGGITGFANGISSSALAGGTVSACNTSTWVCASVSIQSNGSYTFSNIANATYRLAVTPPAGTTYPSGFYASGFTGNFSVNSANATFVTVAGATVTVPTITIPLPVPPNTGAINTGPSVVVVVSYARPYNSLSTTSVVRVRKGQTVEVIACVGRGLAGTTVEVWRRLPGQPWTFVTTRRVSVSGCSRYIFTPTATAAYRFRVPGSTMTIAVWGPVRNVIVVK